MGGNGRGGGGGDSGGGGGLRACWHALVRCVGGDNGVVVVVCRRLRRYGLCKVDGNGGGGVAIVMVMVVVVVVVVVCALASDRV